MAHALSWVEMVLEWVPFNLTEAAGSGSGCILTDILSCLCQFRPWGWVGLSDTGSPRLPLLFFQVLSFRRQLLLKTYSYVRLVSPLSGSEVTWQGCCLQGMPFMLFLYCEVAVSWVLWDLRCWLLWLCVCACVYIWTCIPMEVRGQTLGGCSSSTISLLFVFCFFADRICHWPGHFSHLLGWLAPSQAPQASWSLPPQGCSIKERSCYKFVKLFCAALHWFPFLLSILWAHTCFSVSQCLFALVKSVRDHPRKCSRSGPLTFCNALIAFVLLRANLDESQILNSP